MDEEFWWYQCSVFIHFVFSFFINVFDVSLKFNNWNSEQTDWPSGPLQFYPCDTLKGFINIFIDNYIEKLYIYK